MGRLVRCTNSTSGWEIEGEHEGYVRNFGAVHRRYISYDGEVLNIIDQLMGSFHHVEACVSFILDSTVVPELQSDHSVVLRRGGSFLGRLIFSGHRVNAESVSLSSVPFSPTFNNVTSTFRVDVRVNAHPGDMIKTRMEFE